ncbi:uncharacterized protein [Miscanthus floridulus]|uniref:uncharacterized protein n=1 Tax=Miscanthus floridulus TaxID=154761 RepID=UPI00345A0A74
MTEWLEYQTPTPVEVYEYWTMFFDGSLKWEGGGASIVLVSPTGEKLKYILLLHFEVSNNAAEYEAILYGLWIAISLCIKRLVIHGDSQLVIAQIMKDNDTVDPKMTAYCQEVRKLEDRIATDSS